MPSWELSSLYRHAYSGLAGEWVVTTLNEHVVVRDKTSLQVLKTWKLPFPLEKPLKKGETPATPLLTVSRAEPHLIVAYSPRSTVAYVLDVSKDEPVSKFEIGVEGCCHVSWSPLGDSILMWSFHRLRLSIFRTYNISPALHITGLKVDAPAGISFSPDGCFMAVAERHAGKDHVGVYDTLNWSLVRHFPLPAAAIDVADLSWSPCGRYIAVWESPVEYAVHIFTPDGTLLKSFNPHNIESDGNKEWYGLGVRTVRWHPTGDWIAIGGWDGIIRILSRFGWVEATELSCPGRVAAHVTLWKEPKDWIERTKKQGVVSFEQQDTPFSPLQIRPDLAKHNPKMGIAEMEWSASGRWLAVYNPVFYNSVYIFRVITKPVPHFDPVLHSVLTLQLPKEQSSSTLSSSNVADSLVKTLKWIPVRDAFQDSDVLVTLSGVQSGFTTWTEARGEKKTSTPIVEGIAVPTTTTFTPNAAEFDDQGTALLLSDKSFYLVVYPSN